VVAGDTQPRLVVGCLEGCDSSVDVAGGGVDVAPRERDLREPEIGTRSEDRVPGLGGACLHRFVVADRLRKARLGEGALGIREGIGEPVGRLCRGARGWQHEAREPDEQRDHGNS